MTFLALFVSLPTRSSSGRMRVWRAIKALGCVTLRDGVHLLPEAPQHADALARVAAEAVEAGGSGEIYRLAAMDDAQEASLRALFDRSADYADIVEEARTLRQALAHLESAAPERRLAALARRLEQTRQTDYFPGEALRQALAEIDTVRDAVTRLGSPDEPVARRADIRRLDPAEYRGRTWATRARPWVDRLASAWLIRRHIDPEACFVWLASPSDCRDDWLGFDFDGAAFTHVGTRVTFETLLASFGLDADPALARLGELVHCLDVGGLPVAEAPGVETVLAGLRAMEPDDDALLQRASHIFDSLELNYREKTA